MSAIRNRSRNAWPSHSSPSSCRTELREPSAAISHSQPSAYSPSGVATVTSTPSARGRTATTLLSQRRSMQGSAEARSTRYCSNQYCCRLTNAGRRWPGFGQEIESIDELVLEEHLADVPADALVDDLLSAAQPVEDLQRALRVTDGARAHGHRAVLVDDDHGNAALPEIDRRGEADGPGTDDHDGTARARTIELRRARIRIDGIDVRLHRLPPAVAIRPVGRQPSSAAHISLSRSAVQIRGSGYCVASSYARVTSNGRQ